MNFEKDNKIVSTIFQYRVFQNSELFTERVRPCTPGKTWPEQVQTKIIAIAPATAGLDHEKLH